MLCDHWPQLFVDYQRKGAQMASEVVVASDASLVSRTSFWPVKRHMIKMCPFNNIERHDWRTHVIAGTSCPEVWIVVSSANMSHCAEGTCQGRSFIQMEYRRGPRTDSWGTPNKTVLKSDWLSFKETFWRWLLRKEQIKVRVFADRP